MGKLFAGALPTNWNTYSVVFFLTLFVGLVIWIYLPARKKLYDQTSMLPLDLEKEGEMDENKKKEDELLESNYDGIQEYDNDLPKWWLWLFYITIIIAPFYVAYYHFGPGLLPKEQLAVDMAELEKMKVQAAEAKVAVQGKLTDEVFIAKAKDPAIITIGAKLYAEKCSPCHAQNGEGLIGPNLTDNYWIHGGKPLQILNVIEVGVAEKGMVPWKGILKDDEIESLVAYLLTIKNKNLPGKEPQGEAEVG